MKTIALAFLVLLPLTALGGKGGKAHKSTKVKRVVVDISPALQGYDVGEAKVIARDPAVHAYMRKAGLKQMRIGRLQHLKGRMGYSTATTEVSVWRRTLASGEVITGENDFPLTFTVTTRKQPKNGSHYLIDSPYWDD
jgi:ribosomal protein L21E